MNINELERLTGITKQNIRFYEKKGLLHPARNSENNYREYTQDDLMKLKAIKLLRKLDFSLEDIRKILLDETPLEETLAQHLKLLQEKQQELNACIDVCKDLLHKTKSSTLQPSAHSASQQPICDDNLPYSQLRSLDIDKTLQKIDTIERNGGKFMSIINDYKKFATAENLKRFSFKPDTLVLNSNEFREALLQYAEENHLNMVITKTGMYPTFTIDGLEYTAYRSFDRFAAVIHCSLVHPEKLDTEDIPRIRKYIYHFIYGPYLYLLLLFIFLVVTRHSFKWALLVAVMLLPYLCWLFLRSK